MLSLTQDEDKMGEDDGDENGDNSDGYNIDGDDVDGDDVNGDAVDGDDVDGDNVNGDDGDGEGSGENGFDVGCLGGGSQGQNTLLALNYTAGCSIAFRIVQFIISLLMFKTHITLFRYVHIILQCQRKWRWSQMISVVNHHHHWWSLMVTDGH